MAAQVLMAWATAICLLLGIWSAPAVLAGFRSDKTAMNDTTELCYDNTGNRQLLSQLSGLLQGLLDRLSGFRGTTACTMNTLAFGKKQFGAPHSTFAMIKHDTELQLEVASSDVISSSEVSKSGDFMSESFVKYDTHAAAHVSCPSEQVTRGVDFETSVSLQGALDKFRSSQHLATMRRAGWKASAERAYLGFYHL
jgi:hypothetical protein